MLSGIIIFGLIVLVIVGGCVYVKWFYKGKV